ncbi:erythromycin esterase family protein [Accumulibacter sp.]|uniref:erythromycin esterase family protein n=1 Tax=Accumulibacter sp. TaxID=2053492 RepID=UPI001A4A6AC8|nr:erythromycin esterase family protein [Accumulibacter sp.]MBL8402262.1 erythromycin esterase family protein [Accumulibacter sp.]
MRSVGSGMYVRPTRMTRLRWLAIRVLLLLACQGLLAGESVQPPASTVVARIRDHARAITHSVGDYDGLLASIGNANIVLLGESTHGSAEFYDERARITQRLINEKDFRALVLEAGWAPATQLDDFVQGRLRAADAATALRVFQHFPRWVWRNEQFAVFLDHLKKSSEQAAPASPAIPVYGMDLYGVPEAIVQVVRYLEAYNPQAARRARRDYRCFAPYTRPPLDPHLYGRDVANGAMPSCERQVQSRLTKMRQLAGPDPAPAAFAAMMSARAIAGAEAYYRTLYALGARESWNLRERFLAESLRILLERHGKIVVWAHNTHQGDARATDQVLAGELSIGQLMREQMGDEAVFLVGITTSGGNVRAATGWGTPDRVKHLKPLIEGSWSDLLHDVGLPAFVLVFRDNPDLIDSLDRQRLDRDIGVTYLPDAELEKHYWHSSPAKRFDALIHIDTTRAVVPLR